MAKKKTQWRPCRMIAFAEVPGKPVVVPGFEDIECFIRRGMKDMLGQETPRGYTIHEVSTGRGLSRGGTQKQTALNAASVMRRYEAQFGKGAVCLEVKRMRPIKQDKQGG